MAAVDDDKRAAVKLLRSHGYSVIPPVKQAERQQKLWVARWGTMSALVWARSIENAELRVRHQVFNRAASIAEVTHGPVRVHGEVNLREATEADITLFEECGGKTPA